MQQPFLLPIWWSLNSALYCRGREQRCQAMIRLWIEVIKLILIIILSAYNEIWETQRNAATITIIIFPFSQLCARVSVQNVKTKIFLNLSRLHRNPSEWKVTHRCRRFMHLYVSFVRLVGDILIYNRFAKRVALCDTKRGLAKHAKNIFVEFFFFVVVFSSFFFLLSLSSFPKCILLNKSLSGFSTKSYIYTWIHLSRNDKLSQNKRGEVYYKAIYVPISSVLCLLSHASLLLIFSHSPVLFTQVISAKVKQKQKNGLILKPWLWSKFFKRLTVNILIMTTVFTKWIEIFSLYVKYLSFSSFLANICGLFHPHPPKSGLPNMFSGKLPWRST